MRRFGFLLYQSPTSSKGSMLCGTNLMKPIHISTPSLMNLVVTTMPSDKAELCPTGRTREIKLVWCLKMDRQPDSETKCTVFIQMTKEDKELFSSKC